MGCTINSSNLNPLTLCEYNSVLERVDLLLPIVVVVIVVVVDGEYLDGTNFVTYFDRHFLEIQFNIDLIILQSKFV